MNPTNDELIKEYLTSKEEIYKMCMKYKLKGRLDVLEEWKENLDNNTKYGSVTIDSKIAKIKEVLK